VVRVSFDHVVMLIVGDLVLLSMELHKLMLVVNDVLLMKLDLVLGEVRLIVLKWNVWWRCNMFRIEPGKVSVLDVGRLTFDLQLILILIVIASVVVDIGLEANEMG
jgi:hypothetical protein